MADLPKKPQGGGGRGGFAGRGPGGPGGGARGPGGPGARGPGGPGGRGGGRGGNAGGPGGRGPRRRSDGSDAGSDAKDGVELTEKVVFINRSSKVVKGGRRFSFSALVVVGDKQGRVGLGLGKSVEVSDAIRKGGEDAKHNMVAVSLKQTTIPHHVLSRFGGAEVLLRPASPGTGIIAGKTVRAVLESAGIKDILTKSMGSSNAANVAKATLKALLSLRLREEIYRSRDISMRLAPVAPSL